MTWAGPIQPPDWLRTIRESFPQTRMVLRHMQPTYHLSSVLDVDELFLSTRGVDGVIWDVDGTLSAYHAEELADPWRSHIRTLFSSGTARHAILSNCTEERFVALGRIFPEALVIRVYLDGADFCVRWLQHGVDSFSQADLLRVSRGEVRPVRKPHRATVALAVRQLPDVHPERALMVGDQYVTDVAAASMAGIRSAKVPTLAPRSFPRTVRTLQRIEGGLYRVLHGPGGSMMAEHPC